MKRKLGLIYRKLYTAFGPQHWWPGDSSFEVMVGAILTQNTSWLNVEKAIGNLKKHKVLAPDKLFRLSHRKTAKLIRSAGYYNIKTARLKEFLNFLLLKYRSNMRKMAAVNTFRLRQELLLVKGIGPETADSILLYALNKPVFVVDAYTRRVFSRHGLINKEADYHDVQDLFMRHLKPDVRVFNEYHALLVRVGKDFCLKSKPKCAICPLRGRGYAKLYA